MNTEINSASIEATITFEGLGCLNVKVSWKTSTTFTAIRHKEQVIEKLSKQVNITHPKKLGNKEVSPSKNYIVSFFVNENDKHDEVDIVFNAEILALGEYGISLIKGIMSMDISLENIFFQKTSTYSGSTHDPRH